jgi:hypothetical protein
MCKTRLLLLSLLTVFALSAVASAGASAEMYWIKEGKALKEGVKYESESHGAAGEVFVLKSSLAGVKVKIECDTEAGDGWVENPVGGGNATGVLTIELTDCSVPEPAEQDCKVDEPIVLETKIRPVLISLVVWAEFAEKGSGPLSTITFAGCKIGALNTSVPLTGTFDGLNANGDEEGSFEFKAGTNESLTFGGNAATFRGKIVLKF